MRPVKEIFLSVISTGSTKESSIMNLSLVCQNDSKAIYVERMDFDINEIINSEYLIGLHDSQLMKLNSETVLETSRMDFDLKAVKEHDNIIQTSIAEFLEELSEDGEYTLNIWTDNPIDWFHFINIAFYFEEQHPVIPEFINPYPTDINAIFGFIKLNSLKDLNEVISLDDVIKKEEEFTKNSLKSAVYNLKLVDHIKTLF